MATGNTAAAQQASLDIQGLQSDQQYNAQKKAIEDALKLANAPLEAKIKSINDGQQKLSDNAALAAEKLEKLNKAIDTEKQKIDDVNKAMTTLAINAIAAGKELKDYIMTGTDENPDAGRQDAAGLVSASNVANPGSVPAFKPSTHPKGKATPIDVGTRALGLMGGVTGAVEKGLAAKGINVNSMTGDIYINGKKMDVGPTKATAKVGFVPTTIPAGSGAYSGATFVQPSQLTAAGATQTTGKDGRSATWVGVEFLDKNGKKWKVVSDGGRMGLNVQKAGYGTMKLDPKIPTIVGDRGPEMAFGGMVIPNMAKVPFSSPRYDVKQASKMFEPMRDAGGTQGVINYTQHIHASPGMNEDQLITKAKIAAYEFLQSSIKSNAKMVGTPMNVSIKRT